MMNLCIAPARFIPKRAVETTDFGYVVLNCCFQVYRRELFLREVTMGRDGGITFAPSGTGFVRFY